MPDAAIFDFLFDKSMGIRADIKAYARPISFHTPGHKGRLGLLDITEIEGQHPFPGGRIADAERSTAAYYGSKALRYSVGGSSLSLKAALMCVTGTVIVPRDAHRSVFDGAKLAGLEVITVENRIKDGLPQPLSIDDLLAAYRANAGVSAVVIQSPDYYGQVADIDAVTAFCRERGLMLIADAAHGAHFFTRPDLFPPCFASVADFTALSAHKTLRAYTQTAYLAVNRTDCLAALDENLALLSTTSPSYLFLLGLSEAAQIAARGCQRYDALFAAVQDFKNAVKTLNNDDFTRLVIDAAALKKSGGALYEGLLKEGIAAEKFDDRYVVCIVTADNTVEEIDALKRAVIKGA